MQLCNRAWQRFPLAFEESRRAGAPTEDWNHLLDTEKGFETLYSFMVQVYGYNFAGLTGWAYFSNQASILLSLHGLATYIRDIQSCQAAFMWMTGVHTSAWMEMQWLSRSTFLLNQTNTSNESDETFLFNKQTHRTNPQTNASNLSDEGIFHLVDYNRKTH